MMDAMPPLPAVAPWTCAEGTCHSSVQLAFQRSHAAFPTPRHAAPCSASQRDQELALARQRLSSAQVRLTP